MNWFMTVIVQGIFLGTYSAVPRIIPCSITVMNQIMMIDEYSQQQITPDYNSIIKKSISRSLLAMWRNGHTAFLKLKTSWVFHFQYGLWTLTLNWSRSSVWLLNCIHNRSLSFFFNSCQYMVGSPIVELPSFFPFSFKIFGNVCSPCDDCSGTF